MPSPNCDEKDENSSDESGEISVILRSSHHDFPRENHITHHLTPHRTPEKSKKSGRGPCMADIGSLVRRVKSVKLGFTPETCV